MATREICCAIDFQKIKRSMDQRRESIRKEGGTSHSVPIEAVVRKVDEGISEATFPSLPGGFVLRCDEQAEPVFYGTGSAPQPLDIFLAGIGMTMASVYVEAAADMNLTVDSVEIRVRGDLDVEGILDLHGAGYGHRPGFSRIAYTVQVGSKEKPERLRELFEAVERRCPARNTVTHGTRSDVTYVVNGDTVTP